MAAFFIKFRGDKRLSKPDSVNIGLYNIYRSQIDIYSISLLIKHESAQLPHVY